MRQLTRLIRYALPYWWQILSSVTLMAAVGALDAFKFVLIRPVFDRVLNPATGSKDIQLFVLPVTHHPVYLQQLLPSRFTNAWTMVAVALIGSTILKGIFDYTGTYLVNHAGFGMITDLRDDLYNAIMRRSAAFFSRHTTGTLLSTIINDIERVQYAMSTVGGCRGCDPRRETFLGAVAVRSSGCLLFPKNRLAGAQHDQARAGQAG
jgi:subfamily B ATP-binding cassette protein MsbA